MRLFRCPDKCKVWLGMNSLLCCSERDQSHRKKYDQQDETENDACRSGAYGFLSIGMRKITQKCRLQDTRWVSPTYESVIKKKSPGVQTLHKIHRACFRAAKGRSALCQEDTPSAPLTRVVISGGQRCFWLGEKRTSKRKGFLSSHAALRFMSLWLA